MPNGDIEFWLQWDGLSGPPIDAHIHVTVDGTNSGTNIQHLWAIRDTSADTANSAHGTFTPSADLIDKMNNGNAYVNIHTTAKIQGEIAGLIVKDGSHHVKVVAGEAVSGINFLNKPVGPAEEWDFGDLPDTGTGTGTGNYKTLESDDGARHKKVDNTIILGHEWDKEADGQPTANADGDDTTPAGGPDDEDGVAFTTSLTVGSAATLEAEFSGTISTGRFDGWVDFNADGDFDDSGEHVVTNSSVAVGPPIAFSFAVPAGATLGTTYARFRVRTDTDPIGWSGPRDSGEVEDYKVTIGDGTTPTGEWEMFDFGSGTSPVEPDWTRVVNTDTFTTGGSHGWEVFVCCSSDTSPNPASALYRDNNNSDSGPSTFIVQLGQPNADYEVTAHTWASEFSNKPAPINGMLVENAAGLGQSMLVNVPASTEHSQTFTATSDSNSILRIRIQPGTDANNESFWLLSGLEFHREDGGGGGDPTLDFGDAPDPATGTGAGNYNTLASDNGPSHVATGPTLGTERDAEADAHQSADADGDDTIPAGGPDDEDGVTFSGTITPGGQFTLTFVINNQGGSSAFVDAWMDFNHNGVFDLSEIIINGATAADGSPQNYAIVVPETADPGMTYARFRVSTSPTALGPTGPADDGEVEDYKITIEAPFVDLEITSVTGGVAEDPASGPGLYAVTFLYEVCNNGNTASGSFDVLTEFDGQTFGSTIGHSSLGAGACANDPGQLIYNGLSVAPGDHTLTVTVDPNNQVTESNENNNSRDLTSTVVAPAAEWDFGDLPDAPQGGATVAAIVFQTLLDNDGPRHKFLADNDVILGTARDMEADGQPTIGADGDDISPAGSPDDEDGVSFTNTLVPGGTGMVDITATGSATVGSLDAWIDFNQDGDFADVGEHIVVDATMIPGGPAQTFDFSVPSDAAEGMTYARFRIRPDFDPIAPFGPRDGGEVEDYTVDVQAPPPFTQIIDDGDPGFSHTADWDPDTSGGFNGGFRFTLAPPFQNTETATWTFDSLTPGTYKVSATWVEGPSRVTDAPFTIFGGATPLGPIDVNQQLPPDDLTEVGTSWEDLGTVTISGSTLSVDLTNEATDGLVIADAIRIEKLPPPTTQIIDDGDPGFSFVGDFVTVSGSGFQNDFHYVAGGTGANSASWTFDALTPGTYQVSATWISAANRALDAPFTVVDGTTPLATVDLNQTLAPDDRAEAGVNFEDLGVFTITGSTLKVELTDDADNFVIADAVRIERLP